MEINDRYIIALISVFIAVLGWVFSSYINNRAFNRAEISKLKDKISTLFDDFFKELLEKTEDRGITEDGLDEIITDRLAIIELHLNHLKRKSKLDLVSTEMIGNLRIKPYELILNAKKIDGELREIKMNILENIEENYTRWYFNQKFWSVLFAPLSNKSK
ncbi:MULTISPECIES: hypothetical protein [unclassified Providencia]|uniref:hypothetical protein n=1 Tax=unclassified Providencia TaxID=2633465 RepID=UPI00234B4E44|nr:MULTISPECIES: hypothetical protein [unclassified Providencia]